MADTSTQEIVNPKVPSVSPEELLACQRKINAECPAVRVRDLQIVQKYVFNPHAPAGAGDERMAIVLMAVLGRLYRR